MRLQVFFFLIFNFIFLNSVFAGPAEEIERIREILDSPMRVQGSGKTFGHYLYFRSGLKKLTKYVDDQTPIYGEETGVCDALLTKGPYHYFHEDILTILQKESFKEVRIALLDQLEHFGVILQMSVSDNEDDAVWRYPVFVKLVIDNLVKDGFLNFERPHFKTLPIKVESPNYLRSVLTAAKTHVRSVVSDTVTKNYQPVAIHELSVSTIVPNHDKDQLKSEQYQLGYSELEMTIVKRRWNDFLVIMNSERNPNTVSMKYGLLEKTSLGGLFMPPKTNWHHQAIWNEVTLFQPHASNWYPPNMMRNVSVYGGTLRGMNLYGVYWNGENSVNKSKIHGTDLSWLNRSKPAEGYVPLQKIASKDGKWTFILENVEMRMVNLEEAVFDHGYLKNVVITGNLDGASFKNATLENVYIEGSANNADFTDVTILGFTNLHNLKSSTNVMGLDEYYRDNDISHFKGIQEF